MEVELYKMRYKLENGTVNLRILGKDFEKNNRNKGKLIINNKKYPIESVIQINNINQNYIKMVIFRNIYNKSCMFKNCELLESLKIYFHLIIMKKKFNIKRRYMIINIITKSKKLKKMEIQLIIKITVMIVILFLGTLKKKQVLIKFLKRIEKI